MENFERFRIYLTRYEVFPGWTAWTLVPVGLALLAIVAAFAFYGWSLYRRWQSPAGINWDAELGMRRNPPLPSDPGRRGLARLKFGAIAVLMLASGVYRLRTGHASGHVSLYDRTTYSADGMPVYFSGGILCLGGLLLGAVALFADSAALNRPLDRRDTPE